MNDAKEMPNWAKNKLVYQKKYNINNTLTVSCRLNKKTDNKEIEIWENLPNKSQFIKAALTIYSKTNGFEDLEEYTENNEDE